MNESCSNCRFWARVQDAAQGQCRRYPPQAVGIVPVQTLQGMAPTAMFAPPETRADSWCGEWSELLGQFLVQQ